MHRVGANNDSRVVGNFLLLLGRGDGPGGQTDEERWHWLEQGLVYFAGERSRRGHVPDPPAAKHLGHVSKNHKSVPTGALGGACVGIPCV